MLRGAGRGVREQNGAETGLGWLGYEESTLPLGEPGRPNCFLGLFSSLRQLF